MGIVQRTADPLKSAQGKKYAPQVSAAGEVHFNNAECGDEQTAANVSVFKTNTFASVHSSSIVHNDQLIQHLILILTAAVLVPYQLYGWTNNKHLSAHSDFPQLCKYLCITNCSSYDV